MAMYDKKKVERHLLGLFYRSAHEIPAYKDFLKKNKVRPDKVKTMADWISIPPMSKDEYLRKYPLEKLCWGGKLKDKSLVFTSTSGSTGEPFYFPRVDLVDCQSSVLHEIFLNNTSRGKKVSTLVIDSFGMGVWIGGIITYQAFRKIALRGYPVSVITPGINKKEIFEALKNIASRFDQVILCGYPPFIKNIIDEGNDQGINWKKINLKLLFAAEAFTESFRDYLLKKTGIKDACLDTINIYGSADLGTMALESPLSILSRKLLAEKRLSYEKIFPGVIKTPTIAEFNPLFVNFEERNGRILCTGDNALPLIRYDIGDHGGVCEFDDFIERFRKIGIDLLKEAKKRGITKTINGLPFVYVYERADFGAKLFGAIIYPEHIREVLLHDSLQEHLTGKFTVVTKHDVKENQYLEINLELKSNKKHFPELAERVKKMVVDNLLAKNAEYKNNYGTMPGKVTPKIVFWQYEDQTYFKQGTKQKWVIK